MADEPIRVSQLDPERLRDWYLRALRDLQLDIDAIVREIDRREFRELLASWDGQLGEYFDPALPDMRSRLAQRRAKLAELLGNATLPEGMGDGGLVDVDKIEDPAMEAVKELIEAAARQRVLPVGDPLVSDEEVEEEHERQLGDRRAGSARRGPVRPR